MSTRNRISRPKGELKKELIEQLQLLRLACHNFDSGFEASGKDIAMRLRVLLHHYGQSHSLLAQLGMRSGRFFDSAGSLHPGNILTECNLIAHSLGEHGGRYIPLVQAGMPPNQMKPIPFVNWWNDPVLKDNKNRTFCRWELVANVSNTDGGGHVDPKLDEAYMALSRSNSLGWSFAAGETIAEAMQMMGPEFEGRPELACMRQIAHELLCSIHKFFPEYKEHAQPVIPDVSRISPTDLRVGPMSMTLLDANGLKGPCSS